MLWDIQARMKPALSVIELIPNVHRTPALAALRRAVLEARPVALSPEDRELAFLDAKVKLTSPIGARVLWALYQAGQLKLKKPATRTLPALQAYIATEAVFRADIARIMAAEAARPQRLAKSIPGPGTAPAQQSMLGIEQDEGGSLDVDAPT